MSESDSVTDDTGSIDEREMLEFVAEHSDRVGPIAEKILQASEFDEEGSS